MPSPIIFRHVAYDGIDGSSEVDDEVYFVIVEVIQM
jgi:hypothetical protein